MSSPSPQSVVVGALGNADLDKEEDAGIVRRVLSMAVNEATLLQHRRQELQKLFETGYCEQKAGLVLQIKDSEELSLEMRERIMEVGFLIDDANRRRKECEARLLYIAQTRAQRSGVVLSSA
jgi:hypothetical protein